MKEYFVCFYNNKYSNVDCDDIRDIDENFDEYVNMFNNISTWLNAPPLPAIINPSVSLPSTSLTGLGSITFPAMATLGLPCWATITTLGLLGVYPLDPIGLQQNAYEQLSNFIYLGLLSNFIAPIPTVGNAIPAMTRPMMYIINPVIIFSYR